MGVIVVHRLTCNDVFPQIGGEKHQMFDLFLKVPLLVISRLASRCQQIYEARRNQRMHDTNNEEEMDDTANHDDFLDVSRKLVSPPTCRCVTARFALCSSDV